jgi:hypothetical protein
MERARKATVLLTGIKPELVPKLAATLAHEDNLADVNISSTPQEKSSDAGATPRTR